MYINSPPLVLKAGHLCTCVLCLVWVGQVGFLSFLSEFFVFPYTFVYICDPYKCI